MQAGGPVVAQSRGQVRLTAPLTAISAAVVGVILNLGLDLGRLVLVPERAVDLFAVAVALTTFASLVHFGRVVLEVVAVAALAGLLRAIGAG